MAKNKPPALILASGSAARKSMLENAGLAFEVCPADLDEKKIQDALQGQGKSAADIALALAEAKAVYVSASCPDALVIGSDQVLNLDGQILSKAKDENDARAKLQSLSGKTHHLISAVCLARNSKTLWAYTDQAALHMRDFDDGFLDAYMAKNTDALTACVGAYKIEGGGAWLFSAIEGSHFTIMGMPLLPLLNELQTTYGFRP